MYMYVYIYIHTDSGSATPQTLSAGCSRSCDVTTLSYLYIIYMHTDSKKSAGCSRSCRRCRPPWKWSAGTWCRCNARYTYIYIHIYVCVSVCVYVSECLCVCVCLGLRCLYQYDRHIGAGWLCPPLSVVDPPNRSTNRVESIDHSGPFLKKKKKSIDQSGPLGKKKVDRPIKPINQSHRSINLLFI